MSSKRGPKFTPIDWKQFDILCGIQCTKREIADVLDVSEDTIERAIKREFKLSYAVYYEQKSAKGRMSLRRKQYEVAQSGNVTMLIWLGKQYLGQAEKSENKATVHNNISMKSDEELDAQISQLTKTLKTPGDL